jgi:hypothetical protein
VKFPDRQQILRDRRNAGKDRTPELPETPPGYVDAVIVMTKILSFPFVQSKVMEGDAQVFRIGLQVFGRRVANRMMVELKVSGATINKFPAYPILGFGYSTTQIDPYMIRMGEVVEVSSYLAPADRWWVRWVDQICDWWSPPKARVIVSGVVRMPEVEA